MSKFVTRGPLPPNSRLFRGRQAELAGLLDACSGPVEAYALIYGGRQMGKTSLLRQLEVALPASVAACRVDCGSIPRADTNQAYTNVARSLARAVAHGPETPTINSGGDFVDVTRRILDGAAARVVVLMLEGLGALQTQVASDLANVIRAIFTGRHGTSHEKLMVVLAGNLEIYNLSWSLGSPLHNVCDSPTYLGNLDEPEAVALIRDVLVDSGFAAERAQSLGEAVYERVSGHPYLTQRLGSMLESRSSQSEAYGLSPDEACRILLESDDLVYYLYHKLTDLKLWPAVRRLLNEQPRFDRYVDSMARLELLGLCRESHGRCAPANPLFEAAMAMWLQQSETRAPGEDSRRLKPTVLRVRVFLSSTWQDLAPEREAVEAALRRMQDASYNGMEYFGSRPETPRDVSLAQVDKCDIYVGIFAHRYGSGITEAEYRRATERKMPCLIYFKDEAEPVVPSFIERDQAKAERLTALKQELQRDHTVSIFRKPDDLAMKVVADLHNLLTTPSGEALAR